MAIKFDLFEKLQDAAYANRLMKEGIIKAAGKGDVKFVAAKNYKIGSKFLPLFLVVDNPTPFLAHIKKQGTTVPTSVGLAAVAKAKDGKLTVNVKSATGALSNNIVSTLVKTAAGNDPDFVGTTPEREKAEEEAQESEKAKRPKPDAAAMARASIAQAKLDGKLEKDDDPSAPSRYKNKKGEDLPNINIELPDDVVKQMAKVGLESAQYKKFAASFAKLADQYKFDDYKKVPVNIWSDLMKGLAKSGYIKGKIPYTGDPRFFILAYTGTKGEVIREQMLADAMKGLEKYTAHAAQYLDKVIAEVSKGGNGKSWSFWSGTGAKEAARREAGDGVVLEGSVGSWFDDVWDFQPFTGVENLPLWAAMSELYAKKAAENYTKFQFYGFVGPGSTREQSVFNKIEQPTFVEVLNVKKTVAPPTIRWFVVDCAKNSSGAWVATGNESARVASRQAAMTAITSRYGS